MHIFLLILSAGNLLLTTAMFCRFSRLTPPDTPSSSGPASAEEARPDPIDEGFENIMRFTVQAQHTRGDRP